MNIHPITRSTSAVLCCENKAEGLLAQLCTFALAFGARRHDQQAGVVVGAVSVLIPRLRELRVFVQTMWTHQLGEVSKPYFGTTRHFLTDSQSSCIAEISRT